MRAATQVTPTIAMARIANDIASSHVGILPAVQRTGVAIGVVNGTSDSVRANVELGSFVSPKIDKYEIISRYVTGCWACRASCSLLDIAPTAANIAEYRRKPPRKNAMNTARVAGGMCGNDMVWTDAGSAPNARAMGRRSESSTRAETPQIANWKNETAPAPRILPSISWKGRTDETSTSIIRVVFSSSTELITFTPYSRMAMNSRIAMKYAVKNDCAALSETARPCDIFF